MESEDIALGSDVFLIDYPGEDEQYPQPRISRGILSQLRELKAISVTYFQTDAVTTGG